MSGALVCYILVYMYMLLLGILAFCTLYSLVLTGEIDRSGELAITVQIKINQPLKLRIENGNGSPLVHILRRGNNSMYLSTKG